MIILTVILGIGSLILAGKFMKSEKLKRRLEEFSDIQLNSVL